MTPVVVGSTSGSQDGPLLPWPGQGTNISPRLNSFVLPPQLIRSGETYLSVTNFHDLLCLMCPDFQLRVVKSAFKAAWVVLKGGLLFLLHATCCPPETFPRVPFVVYKLLSAE